MHGTISIKAIQYPKWELYLNNGEYHFKKTGIRVYPPVAESIPGYKIFRFKIMKYCFKRNNACNNNHDIFNYLINRFFLTIVSFLFTAYEYLKNVYLILFSCLPRAFHKQKWIWYAKPAKFLFHHNVYKAEDKNRWLHDTQCSFQWKFYHIRYIWKYFFLWT